jgi:hypothetical protein
MSSFNKDLEFGQSYELKLLEHIKYKSYEQAQGNFKDYDIKVFKKNGQKFTYEIKADKLISVFGNICIEFNCRGKPSGIETSKANFWCIFNVVNNDKYELYKIRRTQILNMIKDKKYKRITSGGDDYQSKLYLFDKNLFKDYIIFSNIDE